MSVLFLQECTPRLFCPYKHLPDSLLNVQSQNPKKTRNKKHNFLRKCMAHPGFVPGMFSVCAFFVSFCVFLVLLSDFHFLP